MSDIRFATLLDWAEGRLDEAEERPVAEALARGDAQVREAVEWIQGFLAAARLMPLHPPPPEVSARLRDTFADHVSPARSGSWSTATLLQDSRWPQAAAGLRSAGAGEAVILAFDSEFGRFLLEATPAGDRLVDVDGLLAMPTPLTARISLAFMRRGEFCRAVSPSPNGAFRARGLPEDVDELWLLHGATPVRASVQLRPS